MVNPLPQTVEALASFTDAELLNMIRNSDTSPLRRIRIIEGFYQMDIEMRAEARRRGIL